MYRALKPDELIATSEKLTRRIAERFPGAGLGEVAAEVLQVTREAVVRAETIRRPNLWLRAGLVVLLLLAAAGAAWQLLTAPEPSGAVARVWELLDATKGVGVYLVGAVIFLVTLETRLKRGRALKAIHELRSIAHIIDMHQLAKDPDPRLERGPVVVSGRAMDAESIGQYLQFCTELLALVSKIGQLYVQDFPDATALAAVDQCEDLATGLSSKIWQKIMILDQIRSETDGPAGSDGPPRTEGQPAAAPAAPAPKDA